MATLKNVMADNEHRGKSQTVPVSVVIKSGNEDDFKIVLVVMAVTLVTRLFFKCDGRH